MEPISAIIIGLLVLLIAAFIIWPQNGLIVIWKRHIWNAKKVLIEDALKYLYQQEEKNAKPTAKSMEEALRISSSKAYDLVITLERSELIITVDYKI